MLSRILAGTLAVGAAIVCIRLGFWQLDRHEQRAAQNALIEQRLSDPPLPLPLPLPLDASLDLDRDSHEFRRARVKGVFDYSREVIEQGRVVNGVPAVYLVTPLALQNGGVLLVERGYALSPDARGVDVAALRESDSVVVEGVLVRLDGGTLPSDATWPIYVRRADPAALQPLFDETLEPLVLRRTVMPSDLPRGMGAAPLPQLTGGPHLSYAVQWFLFATIAVVGPLVASGVFKRR